MDIWGNSEVATLVFLYIFPAEDKVVLLFPVFWWDIEVSKKKIRPFSKKAKAFLNFPYSFSKRV